MDQLTWATLMTSALRPCGLGSSAQNSDSLSSEHKMQGLTASCSGHRLAVGRFLTPAHHPRLANSHPAFPSPRIFSGVLRLTPFLVHISIQVSVRTPATDRSPVLRLPFLSSRTHTYVTGLLMTFLSLAACTPGCKSPEACVPCAQSVPLGTLLPPPSPTAGTSTAMASPWIPGGRLPGQKPGRGSGVESGGCVRLDAQRREAARSHLAQRGRGLGLHRGWPVPSRGPRGSC